MQDGLQKSIMRLARDPKAHGFELGMLQTLRAVEKALQTQYEYGLGNQMRMLPVFRLGAGGMRNPLPKQATPDTLSKAVDSFLADMTTARATLDAAESTGVQPFELTLQDIWFDINANGARDRGEDAITILGPMVLGRRNFRSFTKSEAGKEPLTIRFDQADHAWLLAYTHMLSGFGNFYRAFDPAPVLRDLKAQRATLANAPEIPNFYDPAEVENEIAALEAEQAKVKAQLDSIRKKRAPLDDTVRTLRSEQRKSTDEARKAELQVLIDQLTQEIQPLKDQYRQLSQDSMLTRNELRAAQGKRSPKPGMIQQMAEGSRAEIDLIYVIIKALAQQPDPARIQAAHGNWMAMITQNRKFWALLAEETDNDHEWIPNPQQVSALPITIPPRVATGWQNILADAEAVLEGKLLLPHPLLPTGYGINLRAYVNDPGPLVLVDWIHGVGAYPYVARGPLITAQSWQAFRRLAGGNAGGLALFFN